MRYEIGNVITPKLLTAALEHFIKLLDWEENDIKRVGEYLTYIRFADDVVRLVKTI